jgi:hypothetical protein
MVNKKGDTVKVGEFAFQFDASEKGFTALKDFYGKIIDPWTGWVGIQGGIFLRPFGYESPAPPATHESPEFSRMNQTIMPNECELGEALVVESPRKFTPVYLRFDASLVNGEGIGVGTQTGTYQNRKDFITRVIVGKVWELKNGFKVGFNASGSFYYGGVRESNKNKVFQAVNDSMKNIITSAIDTNGSTVYKRQYYGAHAQVNLDYKIGGNFTGTTMLRVEYIGGQQPGQAGSSQVPLGTGNVAPVVDMYVRRFSGLMAYLTQSFHYKAGKQQMHSDITVKFDMYDPNTAAKGVAVNKGAGYNATDLAYNTVGVGYTWCPVQYFKLVLWYDHVMNESSGLSGWTTDYKKDDVFTLRTQFMIDTWWFDKKSGNKNLISRSY